jgi:ABC-type Fe3+-hydroxamate transport system substrate-binding protein
VIDDLGRTVKVPYDPTRVAALSPNVVDIMYRLGLRSHIVGEDCYLASAGGLSEDYSPDQIANWSLTSSLCVQVAPSFDFEGLLAQAPTLVITSTIISVADVDEIQDTYHIPVLMLQPPTLSGIVVDVSLLGQIFGVNATASQLNDQVQFELAVAQNVTQNLSNQYVALPTVFVTYYVDSASSTDPGYYSYGPSSFGESLIELASATSICANATLPYPFLTGDQVLLAEPQIILYGTGYQQTEATYASGPDWSLFGAVQNHTAYGINSNWLTEPDPTMILQGLPQLLTVLHPGVVGSA